MMTLRKPVLLSVLAVGIFASGWISAQDSVKAAPDIAREWSDAPKRETGILVAHSKMRAKRGETDEQREAAFQSEIIPAHKRTIEMYGFATSRPDVADEIASDALAEYWRTISIGDRSAMQCTQASGEIGIRLQALQVSQNARIIQLLQKIADKQK